MLKSLVVKCHASRCQDENRKAARESLTEKLDQMINGENSVAEQKRRIAVKKFKTAEYKKQKKVLMIKAWKEREGIK
ncbi:Probable peptide chain release factor C12orf65, mitochondrial [Eumeta japonica]|uniref:Probable peptide chain release factor C12orf65, mitochondrial n=1 Tax=Eumeta variegata TaxID=151549 RepID=A0A4C1TKA0_EUMVA|nr:Probable peptide chain release factor C12orf65, mitochondrial [Eumeta japonica]